MVFNVGNYCVININKMNKENSWKIAMSCKRKRNLKIGRKENQNSQNFYIEPLQV